jgi:hypothetical protein
MKILSLGALCCAVFLTACESDLSDDVRSALGAREAPQVRSYSADQRATFDAAREVAEQMGFRITRSGAAAGVLEGVTEVSAGDEPGSSRQVSLKVRLSPGEGTSTQMELSLTEVIEAQSSTQEGLATQTPLRDTPMYADFFRGVERALKVSPNP